MVERAYSVIPVHPFVSVSIQDGISNLHASFSGSSHLHLSFSGGGGGGVRAGRHWGYGICDLSTHL